MQGPTKCVIFESCDSKIIVSLSIGFPFQLWWVKSKIGLVKSYMMSLLSLIFYAYDAFQLQFKVKVVFQQLLIY